MERMIEGIADLDERERALDPSRSFVVQAPAGSGKTELLMQRFLALLSHVERPEQILAMTFTRKAAGEMRNRIAGALQKAADGYEPAVAHEAKTIGLARVALERDAALGWGLLDNPGRLKVQTLDSLSAELVRLTPLLSRLGRQPSIEENAEELYREAARKTVEMVEEESPGGVAVRKALSHLDNSVKGLTLRLVEMLGKRDQWHRHVKRKDEEDLRGLLEGSLEEIVEAGLDEVKKAFPPDIAERLFPLARYAAEYLNSAGSSSVIALLAGIGKLPDTSAKDLPAWQAIREFLLTKGNGVRKPRGVDVRIGFSNDKKAPEAMAAKRAFQGLLEDMAERDCFIEALSKVQELPPPRFDDGTWEILEALLHLLPMAEARLDEVFAERGAVDFQAVSMAALSSLGSELDPTELMLSLDLRLRHILVDEYQDTSQAQLSLLTALTRGWEPGDGRTLFIVGDPMQSIYLFREAQVGLFLDARSGGIGGVRLDSLRLKTNFRSTDGIVGWVNDGLSRAFPETEDSFTGSISYAPSVAVKKGIGAAVSARLFRERDDEAEAAEAVSVIKALPDGETAAVLCRSRNHADAVMEGLKREGISFRAQDMDSLSSRTVIQDIFALLRALAHPYDRVAWLAILRAPWCGLSLADLHALCAGDCESPVRRLIRDRARLAKLSEDGRKRLERTSSSIEKALAQWGRARARDVVEGLWIALGGPACVVDAPSMKDAEAFFNLLEPLGPVVGQAELKNIDERMEKLYADHGGVEDTRVDVMTIHKAKGLEFDHVIIPGLGRKAQGDKKKLLLWLERGDCLLLAPIERHGEKDGIPVYDYLKLINRKRAAFEQVRILYVAATRARKRLYLFGHVKDVADGVVRANADSFLSVMEYILTPDMVMETASSGPKTQGPPTFAAIKRLPLPWAMPAPVPAVGAPHGKEKGGEAEPEFLWAGEVRRHIGTIVHGYLCRIAKEGVERWDAARVKGETARALSGLRTLGLGPEAARQAALHAVDLVIRALSDKRGRWLLSAHTEGAVEYPLTGVVNGEIVHAVIDRTFVDGGVRWVVDYKTGTHEGGSVEGFLESERERYGHQLDRYAALLRAGGETRGIKKGLYYPALGAWVEI